MFTCCQISTREQIRINFPSQTHWNLGQWCETHFQLLHCHSHNTITLHFYENYLVSELSLLREYFISLQRHGSAHGRRRWSVPTRPRVIRDRNVNSFGILFLYRSNKKYNRKASRIFRLDVCLNLRRESLHFWIHILHLRSILVWNKDSKWKGNRVIRISSKYSNNFYTLHVEHPCSNGR